MKRIITALVKNKSGVLNRVTGLLQRRQFNIESITVGPTEDVGISKMTLVVDVGDSMKLEQLTKQLHKQIDVLKVSDITDKSVVTRELALIKVSCNGQARHEIKEIIEPFRSAVIDVAKDSITIQVTGKPEKVEALIELVRPFGIKELSRTGLTALLRGSQQNVSELPSFILQK